ncbi:MAG: septum site-determining protein MinC [Anaerolineae bacterium]|nr:septum site-determining protein MinC [Anaerolineae bacterium]MCA9907733.1 septum site-determining protein MinC [Anaerolineae bacterium]
MQDQLINIKGVGDGLRITLDEAEEWSNITALLAARIDQQSAFFNGARVTLDVGARPVRKDELMSIKALFDRRGLTLAVVLSDSQTTLDSADALDLRANVSAVPAPEPVDGLAPFNPEEEGTAGVMIRRTLRSGRTVRSAGHVVVFGDVNPGAEIQAVGDVIIWGRLRGTVHAGAHGDTNAVVCALDMTPTQLRIAGYLTTSPQDKRQKPRPEVAFIRDGHIVVEVWE